MNDKVIERIRKQIKSNPILLYMKGSPDKPSCGFSAQAVKILLSCGEKFAYVNVLSDPDVRAVLPKFASWPTFPQLWVSGNLIGGSDIMLRMYRKGELQDVMRLALAENETRQLPDEQA